MNTCSPANRVSLGLGRHTLETADSLVDEDLDERLVWDAAPPRRLSCAAEELIWHAQRNLRGAVF